MQPVVLTALVVWAPEGGSFAVLKVGQGQLVLANPDPQAGPLSEGDLLEITIVEGSTYRAGHDDRCSPERWICLFGPTGLSAVTAPRGTCVAPGVDLMIRQVPLEVSEGFDLDPQLDDTVPAAGADVIDTGLPFQALTAAM